MRASTDDIEYISFKKGGRLATPRVITVWSNAVAISADVRKEIERFKGVRLAKNNLTGDLFMVADDCDEGLPVSKHGRVNSTDMSRFLTRFFKGEAGMRIRMSENLSQFDGMKTYRLTKIK